VFREEICGMVTGLPASFVVIVGQQTRTDIDVVSVGHAVVMCGQHEMTDEGVVTTQKHN